MGIYGKTKAQVDIAAISEEMQPVMDGWFNGTIELVDPGINDGTYDRATNKRTRSAEVVLWTGDARIQAVRWPNVATTRQEAISIRTVVFHIPLSDETVPALILEGFRVRVLDGGMTPQFKEGMFVVTSTVNISYAWDRRIETMQDQGVSIT